MKGQVYNIIHGARSFEQLAPLLENASKGLLKLSGTVSVLALATLCDMTQPIHRCLRKVDCSRYNCWQKLHFEESVQNKASGLTRQVG